MSICTNQTTVILCSLRFNSDASHLRNIAGGLALDVPWRQAHLRPGRVRRRVEVERAAAGGRGRRLDCSHCAGGPVPRTVRAGGGGGRELRRPRRRHRRHRGRLVHLRRRRLLRGRALERHHRLHAGHRRRRRGQQLRRLRAARVVRDGGDLRLVVVETHAARLLRLATRVQSVSRRIAHAAAHVTDNRRGTLTTRAVQLIQSQAAVLQNLLSRASRETCNSYSIQM